MMQALTSADTETNVDVIYCISFFSQLDRIHNEILFIANINLVLGVTIVRYAHLFFAYYCTGKAACCCRIAAAAAALAVVVEISHIHKSCAGAAAAAAAAVIVRHRVQDNTICSCVFLQLIPVFLFHYSNTIYIYINVPLVSAVA